MMAIMMGRRRSRWRWWWVSIRFQRSTDPAWLPCASSSQIGWICCFHSDYSDYSDFTVTIAPLTKTDSNVDDANAEVDSDSGGGKIIQLTLLIDLRLWEDHCYCWCFDFCCWFCWCFHFCCWCCWCSECQIGAGLQLTMMMTRSQWRFENPMKKMQLALRFLVTAVTA